MVGKISIKIALEEGHDSLDSFVNFMQDFKELLGEEKLDLNRMKVTAPDNGPVMIKIEEFYQNVEKYAPSEVLTQAKEQYSGKEIAVHDAYAFIKDYL